MKSFTSLSVALFVCIILLGHLKQTNYLTDIRWERLCKALKAIQERNLCSQDNGLFFNRQTFFVRSVDKKRVFQVIKPRQCIVVSIIC